MANRVYTHICGIYKITDPHTKRFYIGSSKNIPCRIKRHFSDLSKNRHCNSHLQRLYNKNPDLFVETILICKEKDLLFYEQLCFDGLRPAINNSLLAGRVEMTEKVREKISKKVSSLEFQLVVGPKISFSLKGKPKSKQHRLAISNARKGKNYGMIGEGHPMFGKSLSEEAKQKIRQNNEKLWTDPDRRTHYREKALLQWGDPVMRDAAGQRAREQHKQKLRSSSAPPG